MTRELLTVLVVDDELPIRQELRVFPWEAHGFELVGEADNGEEALQFCRNFAPDVVITDITMPVLDGLALFRALKEEHPLTQVVLLTCHSEFAYAREAIQLGAIEYLEKMTMEEADLIRALDKAKDALRREKSLRESEAERRRWALSGQFVRYLKEKEPDPDEFASFLQPFGLALPLCLTAVHAEARKENGLLVQREVGEALTRLESRHPFRWLPAEDGVYLLLFGHEAQRHGMLRGKLEAVVDALQEAIDRQLPYLSGAIRLYAVISEPVRSPEQLKDVYRTLTEVHVHRFYDGAGRIFISGNANASTKLEDAAIAKMTAKLRETRWDRQKLVECLRTELPRWAIKHRVDPDVLKCLVTDWRRDWLRENGSLAQLAETAKAISAAGTIHELVATLAHEVETGGAGKKKLRREVADAIAYIDSHLETPLTLQVVSERVGLSPHYLSRLFREETGISFNDYITKQRMEKAVLLLRTTSMRVYEVAHAVGIPSYRYFSATFREYTGAAPTEYKKG